MPAGIKSLFTLPPFPPLLHPTCGFFPPPLLQECAAAGMSASLSSDSELLRAPKLGVSTKSDSVLELWVRSLYPDNNGDGCGSSETTSACSGPDGSKSVSYVRKLEPDER